MGIDAELQHARLTSHTRGKYQEKKGKDESQEEILTQAIRLILHMARHPADHRRAHAMDQVLRALCGGKKL